MNDADVVRVVTRTLVGGDHDQLARLLERHWGRLLRCDVPLLGRALATMPAPVADRHPALTLIGEILQRLTPGARARGDEVLQRVVDTVDTVEDPAARVGVGLSAQIAMRRRGMFDAARSFGISRVEAAISLGDPGLAQNGSPIAAVELETGLIHLLAGDLDGAALYLTSAHHHALPYRSHAYDAAAKLGLVHALRGESVLAETWLERAHQVQAQADEWLFSEAQAQGLRAAHMQLAIDRLDWRAYHEHNRLAATDHSTENWGWVLYARARAALFLGNQRGAVHEIHLLRDYLPHLFSPRGYLSILLETAEAELWLGIGEIDTAEEMIIHFGDHPVEAAAKARLHMLRHSAEQVAQLPTEPHWPHDSSRRDRLNLLLVQASADVILRPHSTERDQLLARAATELANEVEPWLFTLALAHPAVTQLLRRSTEAHAALDLLDKLSPARPFAFSPGSPPKLTGRETVLLGQLQSSAVIPEIAQRLHVSPATIRNQRKALYRKLGATSRAHALEIAIRHELLTPSAEDLCEAGG